MKKQTDKIRKEVKLLNSSGYNIVYDHNLIVSTGDSPEKSNGVVANGSQTNGCVGNGSLSNGDVTYVGKPNGNLPNGVTTNGDLGNGGHVNSLNVNFFGEEAGPQLVVEVCKEVATIDSELITQDMLTEHFQTKLGGLPDPDLFLYFGHICCMYGFMPWQLRLTEFHSLGRMKSLNSNKFVKVLCTYSKCEQRFGK